jgi:hypothetical protein
MISERLKQSQEIVQRDFYPHFAWIENDAPPFQLPAKPVAQSRVAYITSCGLYRRDTQLPFDAHNHLGDPSFRELHSDTPPERLAIAHTHYRHEFAEQDYGVVIPFEHFRQLEAEGVIGEFYQWVYSFMGFLPEPAQFLRETVPTLTQRLKQDAVDAAIFTPC